MRLRHLTALGLIALTACGGGSGTAATSPATPAGAASSVPSGLVSTAFSVGLPSTAAASASSRSTQYLGAGAASVTITLNSVNGGAPPVGLTTLVTSSIVPADCPCSVSGPLVPPGSDNFTFTTYDGAGGTGNALATTSGTYTITAGVANTGNAVTLLGQPKTMTFGVVPSGTAGTSFGSSAPLSVSVKDADGYTISGTYAYPITVVSSNSGGALTISTAGSDNPPAGELLSSSDTLSILYSGLAIAPVTITASATGATNAVATFTPTLSPIVYSGPLDGATPEIDLYAPSGTGSNGSFTVSEVGLTNAPYNKTLSAATSGCGSIGTLSAATGTSFSFDAVASPAAGSCTITVTDGLGQSKAVTGTYTTSGFGVN